MQPKNVSRIVQVGEPVLRAAARALSVDEIKSLVTQRLIDSMREMMREAPGVGLAAPQVGLSIQMAVIEDRAEYLREVAPERLAERERQPVPFHVLINPRILERSQEQVDFYEGCLSVPGFSALVKRARAVTVEYLDERGSTQRVAARGWYARILQHEIDHLNGYVYIDRMEPRSFTNLENMNKYWKDLPVAQARAALGLLG